MPYLDHLIQIRCQILGCLHPLEPLIWNETRANWIQLTLWNTRSQLTTSKRNTPDESPKDVMNSPLAQQLSALRWRFELIELISTAPFSSGEGALTNKLQPNGSGIIKIANGCDVTCVASVGLSLDIDMSILICICMFYHALLHKDHKNIPHPKRPLGSQANSQRTLCPKCSGHFFMIDGCYE